MNSPDASFFTKSLLDHFLPDAPRAGCSANQPTETTSNSPSIVFLNRQNTRRQISNYQEILDALQEAGYSVQYKKNFDNMTMVEQIEFMAQADIVIGPHGAQFTNTIFQPKCGSLVELFGEHYYVPNFFGSLARLSGKYHFFYYPGKGIALRKYRTTPEYSALPELVVQMTKLAVERWHSCCEHGFGP